MNRINTARMLELLKTDSSEIKNLVNNLLDYSEHISVIEEKMKQLDLQRREKHDAGYIKIIERLFIQQY